MLRIKIVHIKKVADPHWKDMSGIPDIIAALPVIESFFGNSRHRVTRVHFCNCVIDVDEDAGVKLCRTNIWVWANGTFLYPKNRMIFHTKTK